MDDRVNLKLRRLTFPVSDWWVMMMRFGLDSRLLQSIVPLKKTRQRQKTKQDKEKDKTRQRERQNKTKDNTRQRERQNKTKEKDKRERQKTKQDKEKDKREHKDMSKTMPLKTSFKRKR